ncbi:formyltransferase family protein [Salinimonas sediminis]|uniref:Formyl transferase n=1 Tax=Salinimonas sediminis TaxID=2303538 RepID=A0A346NJM1_9ALTE|nr:formyltransferase family protein [Salinimonas sediminis]AXR05728.1 formyl transferase [Salinimonas sediminis]
MKIILCGYHWAGCRALDLLLEQATELFVYTHEAPYHVADLMALANARNIRFSCEKISVSNLPFDPDILVSVYYRYIIPGDVINACQQKAINLHPSLLPRYRGCSSLTWAIINGESEVGYSYHYIDETIDTGNILVQQNIPVYDWDTQGSLYYRVMFEALTTLLPVVQKVLAGEPGAPQQGTPSYYKRGAPYGGEIASQWPLEKVARFIRAMTFPPYPEATYQGESVRTLDDFKQLLDRDIP